MGFRFHKSFKLLSGIRLNMSKSGPSVSVGGKGLTYNFGGKRNRATVGLPGTGLSYSTTTSNNGRSKTGMFGVVVMVLAVGYAMVSAATDGKFSFAHWTNLLSGKESAASKDTQTAKDNGEDESPAPVKHRRHHHKESVEPAPVE